MKGDWRTCKRGKERERERESDRNRVCVCVRERERERARERTRERTRERESVRTREFEERWVVTAWQRSLYWLLRKTQQCLDLSTVLEII